MQLILMLLMVYAATVGQVWEADCRIPLQNIDAVRLATSDGVYELPSEQFFELAVSPVSAIPKDAEFLASGLLLDDMLPSQLEPSYIIYTSAKYHDRYYLELYHINVWNADELEPCGVYELYLD